MTTEDGRGAGPDQGSEGTSQRDYDRAITRRGFASVAGGIAAAATAGCFGTGDSGGGPDVSATVEEQLGRMSVEDKLYQIVQTDLSGVTENGHSETGPLHDGFLEFLYEESAYGSLLSGGGSTPVPNEPAGWAETTNRVQEAANRGDSEAPPLLYGTDAVHGHNNLPDATIFPHNIGLGATWNPQLARDIGAHTAAALRATGVHWNFDPVCDIARDHRWGRYYECFGEDPLHVSRMAAARVRGLQGDGDAPGVDGVAATAKHFVGYSRPRGGRDRNPAEIPWRRLRTQHLAPFRAAVEAGAETVMLNSGSLNGVPGHASAQLVREVLREEMGFEGVVISDWDDSQRLRSIHGVGEELDDAVALLLDAGVDMFMAATRPDLVLAALQRLAEEDRVSEARLDDSVRRILRLKERLDLFEQPTVDEDAASDAVGGNRELAYEAAAQSLVLLDHDDVLPLSGTEDLLVTGPGADDPAMQLGGWTVGWQGVPADGPTPETVTGLAGLEAAADGSIEHVPWGLESGGDLDAAVSAAGDADAAVVFVGEGPYAEGQGDDQRATLADDQATLVQAIHETDTPIVLVTLGGRPLGIGAVEDEIDAHLAAFLPGAEGGRAIADVLLNTVAPSGRLPVSWPRHGGQAPMYHDAFPGNHAPDPHYAFGAGESYAEFEFDFPELDRSTVESPSLDDTVELSIGVENVADVAADRVLLAMGSRDYVSGPEMFPRQTLVGFDRVSLDPGEQRTVTMDCSIGALGIVGGDVDADGERTVVPGVYDVTTAGFSEKLWIE